MKYFEKKKLIPLRIINLKFEKNIELIKKPTHRACLKDGILLTNFIGI